MLVILSQLQKSTYLPYPDLHESRINLQNPTNTFRFQTRFSLECLDLYRSSLYCERFVEGHYNIVNYPLKKFEKKTKARENINCVGCVMSTVACGGSVPPDIHKTPANYRLQRSILMAATYAFNLCNHIANLGVWFDSRPRDVLL